jgi:hypothetical protein
MRISVKTYSGYKADERPVELVIGDLEVNVREVLDRWYGPDHAYFKLVGDNERTYIVRHDERADEWELVMMENPVD